MRAIDLLGADSLDGLEQVVVIGVVGEGQGVVDLEAVLGSRILGPACQGEPNRGTFQIDAVAGRDDDHFTRFELARPAAIIAQGHAELFVDLADRVDQAVLDDGEAGAGENTSELLGFSQGVGDDHGDGTAGDRFCDQFEELGEDRIAIGQPVFGQAERAFEDEDVGGDQLSRFGGQRGPELEVARIEQRLARVFGQEHGRAEAMPGGVGGEPHAAPIDRLPVRQFANGSFSQPQMIEGGRSGRTQGVLMARHVVGVGMGDEGPRLPPAKVDRQIGCGQFEPAVPMKHV